MTDRLDSESLPWAGRIERLLETISTNQAEMQATQLATQTQLDTLTNSQQATQRHLDSLVSTAADMRTRQIITQNQIDSLAALSTDTRQALMLLLQTSVRHEGRLDDLEGQGEGEWPEWVINLG